MRQRGLQRVERGPEVYCHRLIEISARKVFERADGHHAGVVDEYVELPVGPDGRVHRPFCFGRRGEIGGDGRRFDAKCEQVGLRARQLVFVSCGNHESGATAAKLACDEKSESPRSTSYERNTSAEIDRARTAERL